MKSKILLLRWWLGGPQLALLSTYICTFFTGFNDYRVVILLLLIQLLELVGIARALSLSRGTALQSCVGNLVGNMRTEAVTTVGEREGKVCFLNAVRGAALGNIHQQICQIR
jgi:hypothetical protein